MLITWIRWRQPSQTYCVQHRWDENGSPSPYTGSAGLAEPCGVPYRTKRFASDTTKVQKQPTLALHHLLLEQFIWVQTRENTSKRIPDTSSYRSHEGQEAAIESSSSCEALWGGFGGLGCGPEPPPEPGGAEGTAPAAGPPVGGVTLCRVCVSPFLSLPPPHPFAPRPSAPLLPLMHGQERDGEGAAALSPPLETCLQSEPPLDASPDPP